VHAREREHAKQGTREGVRERASQAKKKVQSEVGRRRIGQEGGGRERESAKERKGARERERARESARR